MLHFTLLLTQYFLLEYTIARLPNAKTVPIHGSLNYIHDTHILPLRILKHILDCDQSHFYLIYSSKAAIDFIKVDRITHSRDSFEIFQDGGPPPSWI